MHKDYTIVSLLVSFAAVLAAAAATPVRTDIGNDDIAAPEAEESCLVRVLPQVETGPIKPLNGSNNGPKGYVGNENGGFDGRAYHPNGSFDDFRDLEVPMIRTHDSRFTVGAPNRVNDIALIFPDPAADENDPANYDFTATDNYLATIRQAGCEIMYFLGSSSDSEMGGVPCGTDEPPKDYGKWARIVEHVVRHYNEGWGWRNPSTPFSNQFNIVHWEIGNEADLDCDDSYWKTGEPTWLGRHRYWHGSPEAFFELYGVVARHLRKTFPNLKIGGPGLAGHPVWAERFLEHCRKNDLPLDFFSWHEYAAVPEQTVRLAERYRRLLDRYGFTKTRSYLDEWNWNRGWSDDCWKESVQIRSDLNNFRIAAFYAAVFTDLQHAPVDGLMYYDMRTGCYYNGVFASNSDIPLKGYYSFYAWKKLRRLGIEVKIELLGKPASGVRVVAAKGPDGAIGILVTRHESDWGAIGTEPVRIAVDGRSMKNARVHLTDEFDRFTDRPPRFAADGTLELRLRPYAFAFVEIP